MSLKTNSSSLERIPFNRPFLTGAESPRMMEVLKSLHLSGNGPVSRQCEDFLEKAIGAKKSLLTTSCTDALEMSALLLDIKPGDEVIVPSFTFVSTVNAFVLRGAKPVFADIHPETLNLDHRSLPRLLSDRTRAVVPVHYAGVGCEMDEISKHCTEKGVVIVEDNAHGLFGKFNGKALGSFGSMSTLSFHETKNIVCGEGGSLILNDQSLIDRAEIIREKGTNRSRFFRGQVDKYGWVDLGSSFLPSEILAAFLLAQLERADEIQARRRKIWERYHSELSSWSKRIGAKQPFIPPHCEQTFHMYYLLMPDLKTRTALIEHLKELGIMAVFHYLPLHKSEMAKTLGANDYSCPVAEEVSDSIVRLPFFPELEGALQDRVIAGCLNF